ncbi:unnamed protein product [Diamesa tonsa]
MAEKAAQLQNYNQELVKYIELLKRRKLKIQQELDKDYQEKLEVTNQISILQEKQNELDLRIAKKQACFNKMNDVLNQSEQGYSKVIDSLQVLLTFASKEGKTLLDNEST